MSRRLAFRFDVDSHRCLGVGSRALAAVAERHGVTFSFYVHMGRATQRRRAPIEAARGRPSDDAIQRLSTRTKLGTTGLAHLLLVNPQVGVRNYDAIARLAAAGHEIGLHGGRNHRVWQDDADRWDDARVRSEIAWGRARLCDAGIIEPGGFASPAWTTSPTIGSVVADLGFAYLADLHDPDREGVITDGPLPQAITNVLGEPGGVGYLEWVRAQRWSDDQVLDDFRRRLDGIEDLALVYDHPFWAGVHDARLVDRLLEVGTEEGFEICTVGDAVERSVRS